MVEELSAEIVPAVVLVAYFIVIVIALIAVRRNRAGQIRDRDDIRLEKKFKAKFFRSLTEGFQLESIKTLEDILNIYEAVASLSDEDISYRYGLSRYLREYLVALISKDEKIIPRTTREEDILEWKKLLDRIITENDIQVPYSDLPPLERNILNDITIYLKKGDTGHINDKLKELSRLIKARDGELNRIRKKTDGYLQIALFCLLMSVFAGALAVYLYYKHLGL